MTATFADAVRLGLRTALAEDRRVYLMGEDVAVVCGIFGVTQGLLAEFGEQRVFDTPISEGGFLTAAVGSALMGARPIVEIQLMDFIMVGMDAICNQAAKQSFISNGQLSVPLVIRAPVGVGSNGAGSVQCQYLHSWFMHMPGLKVVMPSTPQDAFGLLLASVRDPNPVLFLEDKRLYPRAGELDVQDRSARLGQARILREGRDVTLVAIGSLIPEALEVADRLAGDGIDVEVLDPRTLMPLDTQAVIDSVVKTGRLVVADPGYPVCSLASEVIAVVARKAFGALRCAPVAVTPPNTPFPWSAALIDEYLPSRPKLGEAIGTVMSAGQVRAEPAMSVAAPSSKRSE